MNYYVDIQHACEQTIPVSDETLTKWVEATLKCHTESAELTLRFVDSTEITDLNHRYRKKNQATNVLAFPANIPKGIELDYPLLGDVVICPTVLAEECINLNKPTNAHWAHIVIHGVLHLLGFDHIDEVDADKMQAEEIKLLAEFGFDNPYLT